MKPKTNNTATLRHGYFCRDCGWPVIFACCNDEMATVHPGEDWWMYCTNQGCRNHPGESFGQHNNPEWVGRVEEVGAAKYGLRLRLAERPEQHYIVDISDGDEVGYIHISDHELEVYCLRHDPILNSPIHVAATEGDQRLTELERAERLNEALLVYIAHAKVCPGRGKEVEA